MKDIEDLSMLDRTINIEGFYTDDIKMRINDVLDSLDVNGKFYEIPQNDDSYLYYYSPLPGVFGHGGDIWIRADGEKRWESEKVPKSDLKYGINVIGFDWKIQGDEVFDWYTHIKKGTPLYEGGFNSVLIKQIGGHFVPTESIIKNWPNKSVDEALYEIFGLAKGDYTLIPYLEPNSNKFINWPSENPLEVKYDV